MRIVNPCLLTLAICQVKEFLILELHIVRLSPELGLLAVLELVVEVDISHDEQANAPADQDGDLSGNVSWGVLWSESLWTNLCDKSIRYQDFLAAMKCWGSYDVTDA